MCIFADLLCRVAPCGENCYIWTQPYIRSSPGYVTSINIAHGGVVGIALANANDPPVQTVTMSYHDPANTPPMFKTIRLGSVSSTTPVQESVDVRVRNFVLGFYGMNQDQPGYLYKLKVIIVRHRRASLHCSQVGSIHTHYLNSAMSDTSLPTSLHNLCSKMYEASFVYFLIGQWPNGVWARNI
jgi:hypothetical protein